MARKQTVAGGDKVRQDCCYVLLGDTVGGGITLLLQDKPPSLLSASVFWSDGRGKQGK
jgi:hypothetical protein